MEKLKQKIESTLIKNLDTVPILASIQYVSVSNTSNILAEEIKDIAIEFVEYYRSLPFKGLTKIIDDNVFYKEGQELFNQFINEKYK